MMSNVTVVRSGQNNGSGDPRALFKLNFETDVLAAYKSKMVTEGRFREKSISEGYSTQVTLGNGLTGDYHVPGTELPGSATPNFTSVTFRVDDQWVVHKYIPDIDEFMVHYDPKAHVIQEMGYAVAKEMERRRMTTLIRAARTSARLSGHAGGTTLMADLDALSTATRADAYEQIIATGMTTLKQKNVDVSEVYCFVPPAVTQVLRNNLKLIDRDYDGSGSISKGTLPMIHGCWLIETNELPNTNVTSGASGDQNNYTGDFTKTRGILCTGDAIMTLTLRDVSPSVGTYIEDKLATLVKTRFIKGVGVYRPETAVELAIA